MSKTSDRSALIVGSTGIVGNNLADHLLSNGWSVAGLARKAVASPPGLQPVVADLLRPDTLAAGLAGLRPTHVFFSTWLRNDTEAENIRVNSAKSRRLGFGDYQSTLHSFTDLFERLRRERLIPRS